MKIFYTLFLSFFFLCYSLTINANESIADGEVLFNKHGCTNCHGSNGIHPTSKHIPALKGKQADYLIKRTTDIFSGIHFSENTRFMHEQFCVDSSYKEEGCYPIPDTKAIEKIAQWLSSDLPEKKETPQKLYVSAYQAYSKMQSLGDNAVFIDIRTRAEVAFLGMPENIDANIPFLKAGNLQEWQPKRKNFKLYPNSQFVATVNRLIDKKHLDKSSPIFLICRSGSRSAKASKLLFIAGYTNVYNIVDGFEGDISKQGPKKGQRVINGWKNSNLPWSYKLNYDVIYF